MTDARALLWGLPLLACAGCSARAGGHAGTDGGSPSADAGVVPTGDGAIVPITECTSVDVLFVVDDSASMADQQASLIASFGGFVDGMRARLSHARDFHVGVVTSDTYQGNAASCQDIGDLVTETGGPQAHGGACGFTTGGDRFLTNGDPDLASRFACVAQVGVGGADDERMARALLNAVDPSRPCNAGFLRPDALLVVVMITDEDDVADGCMTGGIPEMCLSYGSGGTPDDWLAELATRRDPSSVVVLSLLGQRLDNPCGAVPASKLIGFTRRFGANGFTGDVCSSTYDAFFRDALPVVSEACVNLI